MIERTGGLWPQRYARVCGVLYLYIIAAGVFAEVVRSQLVVPTDAAATAANIVANESLFRIGFSGELLHLSCDVGVAVILYALFKQVDRNVALLAAFMRLACILILAFASLSHFAALRLLGGAAYLKAFPPAEREALALLAMRLHGDAYAIGLTFFGFALVSLGYLVYKSNYMPRLLGAALVLGGACYLLNSFAHFLYPAFAAKLMTAIFVPMFLAELALALWLVAKGVDAAKWSAGSGNGSR